MSGVGFIDSAHRSYDEADVILVAISNIDQHMLIGNIMIVIMNKQRQDLMINKDETHMSDGQTGLHIKCLCRRPC